MRKVGEGAVELGNAKRAGGRGEGVVVEWVWGGCGVWVRVCGRVYVCVGGLVDQCRSERWQEWVYVYHCVWDPDPVRLGSRV